MNRWLPVVGGVCMNLALGTLYAWSVFVLPLEQEFGWTRAQTSWTFTIAIVTFAASFILGGRIQDRRGPRICAAIGGTLGRPRLHPVELHDVADVPLSDIRRRRRARQRVRLRDAGAGGVEVVSRQARARRRPDGRRLRSGLGDLRACRDVAHRERRLAPDVPDSRRAFLRDGHDRGRAAEEPARRLPAARVDAADDRSGGAAQHARLRTLRDGAHSDVLRSVGRVLSGRNRGADGHQPARAVCASRRADGAPPRRSPSRSARSATPAAGSCRAGCPTPSAG